METRGLGRPRRRHRPTRRLTFLTLLLLAIAAPAGLAVAGEQSQPYIVVFKDEDVTQQVADDHVYLVHRAPPAKPVLPYEASGVNGVVDGNRVHKHVAELQARMRIKVGNVFDSALGGFSADLTSAQLNALLNDPAVAAVVPDENVTLDENTETGIEAADMEAGGIRTTANPRVSVPAGVRRVGAQRNAVARVDGRDTRVDADVAIIDTGVQRNHPDLNVVGGYNCTGANRNRWDDVDGHGTHVAGIIGALDNRFGVVGVAPGARLWSVKVLGPHGSGRMSWLLCGVDWVTAQRDKKNPSRPFFEVANMSISFGLPASKDRDCGKRSNDGFHEAICRSVAKGTVYVVAAGNESHNAKLNRPAAYDEVITVSAMADYDGRGGGKATANPCPYWTPEKDDAFTSFSNYGPDVDLIAPGRCVLSTYKHSRYAWMSGTSMAAPHVTGAVAVYRAMYPRATPQQVRLALEAVGTRDWRVNSDPDHTPEKAVWIGSFRTMPDFNTSAGNGSARVTVGDDLNLTVSVNRVGGFTEPVSVDLQDPADGISATPTSTAGSSTLLRVQVRPDVQPGNYTLIVRSVSGDLERNSYVPITVQETPPSATLSSVTERTSFPDSGGP